MNYIQEYKVEKNNINGVTKISGRFTGSAGSFEAEIEGDGGNADTCTITLWDGQFSHGKSDALKFTITGCWEFHEVAELFSLIKKQ
jgi:hypothetical protein